MKRQKFTYLLVALCATDLGETFLVILDLIREEQLCGTLDSRWHRSSNWLECQGGWQSQGSKDCSRKFHRVLLVVTLHYSTRMVVVVETEESISFLARSVGLLKGVRNIGSLVRRKMGRGACSSRRFWMVNVEGEIHAQDSGSCKRVLSPHSFCLTACPPQADQIGRRDTDSLEPAY